MNKIIVIRMKTKEISSNVALRTSLRKNLLKAARTYGTNFSLVLSGVWWTSLLFVFPKVEV